MGESGKLRLEDLLGGLAPRGTVKLDERGGPPAITFGIDRRTATEDDRPQAEEFAVWIEERLARGSGVKSGVGLEALTARGLLLKEGDRVVFDSPFFLHWVRSAVAPDLR